MDNEEKYFEIADKLKNLEKVEASPNFTHNLQAKIIELESEKRKEHAKRNEDTKGGFLKDLFGNMQYPWIVPVAGFTVLIFFVFYITYQNKNVLEHSIDNRVTQESKIEDGNEPASPDKSVENQTPPAVTEKKELTSDLNPQIEENNKVNNSGKTLSEKKITKEKSETHTTTRVSTDEFATDVNPELEKQKKVPVENTKVMEPEKNNVSDTKNEESEATDNQGMVSEEKTSAMATVIPESKDTNSRSKDSNSGLRIIMMKINKINKESLEKIHEEVNR